MAIIHRDDPRVRARARALWIDQGRPHGRNDEFWARAHQLVEREIQYELSMLLRIGIPHARIAQVLALPLPAIRAAVAAAPPLSQAA